MITLSATSRDAFPSVQKAREAGSIPAVFYGSHKDSTPIFISQALFEKTLKEAGESTIIIIDTGSEKVSVLIHDVQLDPVTDRVIHVDFYAVDANKKLEVGVKLEFVGVSEAVKSLGGTLVKVAHELEVECLPKDLPHGIIVDISKLETIDSVITVGDLILPAGVIAKASPEEVVASIVVGKEEDLSAPVTNLDPDAIEVEKKGKKDEEETEAVVAE